jgi:heme A synthase
VSFALVAMIAQGILGYVQYARGIPELLVGFHVAGAVTVFGSVQWLLLEMRAPVALDEVPAEPPLRTSGYAVSSAGSPANG